MLNRPSKAVIAPVVLIIGALLATLLVLTLLDNRALAHDPGDAENCPQTTTP